jgi:uncharacterized protein YyaL (SSP411 family)
MPNRLAAAPSPYLRSHADNPVDWWPWGPEAFAEAAERDVPVLVSIGYSTCHWCHVMARESFSDPAIAEIMNETLVAIKVDREEHAEVDTTYLAAAAAFTPNLGWPLNVFVTPQGRAFFAGTYWPPQPVGGHASFRQVLDAVREAWRERRAEVEAGGAAIAGALAARGSAASSPLPDLAAVLASLESVEHREHGGFGRSGPKFPVAPVLRFLAGTGLGDRTLDAMAASPLRDGGFFRYSTQRDWSEPHYERMLYDNAQLLASYALAGRREVAEGIAGFLLDTLRLPGGAFASAQDSESLIDGSRVEGGWYQLDAAARAAHAPPPVDAKVLTGWNGLAIEGLALAGTVLERADWVDAAAAAADWLLEHHVRERLVRVSIDGTLSDAPATLEDYGMLATGLLHLASATGRARYAVAARDLVDACLGGDPFLLPGGGDPVLAAQGLTAEPERSDTALPSGWSALADACERLWSVTAQPRYREAASLAMAAVPPEVAGQPLAFGAALTVMGRLAEPARQLVVVDDVGGSGVASIARRHGGSVVTSEQARAFAEAGFELYSARETVAGQATAYLCEDFVCRLPVTGGAELEALLRV